MTNNLSEEINDIVKNTLTELSNELKESDFQLNLSIPELKLGISSFDAGDLLKTGMESETKSVTKTRRQEGLWGTLCGWFGTDDWGWEDYKEEQTTYRVNTKKMHDTTLQTLNKLNDTLLNQFEGYLEKEFKLTIEDHINDFRNYLSRYQALFNSGIETNKQSQEYKKQLSEQLSPFINTSKTQQSDIEAISRGLG